MPHSREFLEEMLRESKKYLPGWLYASLVQSARPRSGGRASHRVDSPNVFEKLALSEIKPARLKEVDDADLRAIWLRLHQWYSNAKKRKEAVENIVNAGLWVKRELESRGQKVNSSSDLMKEIEELESVEKARKKSVHGEKGELPKLIGSMLEKTPEEVLLIRDFVNIAGSAAVAEKPADIDVVVRAEYDVKSAKYMIDGTSLWVALRRFLTPNKKGPQMQLLAAPQGSFTDYIPVFDLVARRREPRVEKIEPCPPDYEDRERVIKQAKASSSELRAQAEKAKKRDEVTVGEFFYQPKPTRAAFTEEPQTVERFVELYEERKDEWLPAYIQKKYDGANHQAHKDGDKVVIFSEDGDDNTDRLPTLVEAIKKLRPKKLVVPFELEKWEKGQHLPRESVAGYLAEKSEPNEEGIVANVYDILFADRDIHAEPLSERLKVLAGIGINQSTMKVPDSKERLNLAPSVVVQSLGELEKTVEKLRRLVGSEGVVAKQSSSPYRLSMTTSDDWVKFHNATVIKGTVEKRVRGRGGAYTYIYSVKKGKDTVPQVTASGNVPVGVSFSTSRSFVPGDNILIEAETVNFTRSPIGVSVTAWVPRVLGEYKGEPDTVDAMVKRASDNLVLQTKIIDDEGEISYLPANVLKALRPEVPTVGPDNAILSFVGASPGKVEVARKEAFVGPAGETFKEAYLKPLNLEVKDVIKTNAVPIFLEDEQGRTRQPTVEEVKEWHDWLHGELERKKPKIVVALGKTAQVALEDKVDFILPHPSAIRRFGDSGEVSRKVKQIKAKIDELSTVKKAEEDDEGGETRGERASENWEENWHKMLPLSGKGRFVYQHHWRGLSEEETKLSDTQLMNNTDHSVHGDIRLSGVDALWGWAVFLGQTKDNRGKKLNDKLIDWQKDDNIELAPKLSQPKEWLKVGVNKPYISGPGGIGATSEKFSKFFALDSGTYQLGVARQHMVEVFLDGKNLSGRFLFMFAPVAGSRRWLIDKPEDQTPYAEQHDLADVIGELKRKKQKFLIWGKPGEQTKKIDVQTGREVTKGEEVVQIAKADRVKKIVYGIVIDPYGKGGAVPDAHNDWIPPSAVEETAHKYMLGNRVIGTEHQRKANAQVVESWIEPYPSRKDYLNAMKGLPHKVYRKPFGDDVIHSGSWGLAVKLGESEWEAYERGEINAFSPGGFSRRTSITPGMLPKIDFVDLVAKETK